MVLEQRVCDGSFSNYLWREFCRVKIYEEVQLQRQSSTESLHISVMSSIRILYNGLFNSSRVFLLLLKSASLFSFTRNCVALDPYYSKISGSNAASAAAFSNFALLKLLSYINVRFIFDAFFLTKSGASLTFIIFLNRLVVTLRRTKISLNFSRAVGSPTIDRESGLTPD